MGKDDKVAAKGGQNQGEGSQNLARKFSEPHTVSTPQFQMPIRGEALTEPERELVATGLLLAKDFLAAGKFDADLVLQMLRIAEKLGIRPEWDKAVRSLPPMIITER